MKRFVLVTLVAVFLITLSSLYATMAFAEDDVYYLNPEGWPTKHWTFMTYDEIAAYEAAGWSRTVGFVWYDKNWKVVDINRVGTNQIKSYYNHDGYRLVVLYNWVCPGSILNKYEEQSVSVGVWQLPSDMAVKFFKDCSVPEIPVLGNVKSYEFMTQGYYNGQACGEPDADMDVSHFVCVRYV